MSNLSGLLDSARSALLSHQLALTVTGSNIANVNTEGYSRQRLELGARSGSEQRLFGIGAGVEPVALKRVRQEWYDAELRREAGGLGAATAREQLLYGVESLIGEPGTAGIGDALDQFWTAWADLANEPAEEAYRSTVLEAGSRVAERFAATADRLQSQRLDIDQQVADAAGRINSLAEQIAALNQRVQQAELGDRQAPVLRDERDRLVDELSALSGASAGEDGDGVYRVWLGGRALVDGPESVALRLEQRSDAGDGSVLRSLVWSDTGRDFRSQGRGELGGLLQVRDSAIPDAQATLDRIATALVDEVNALHRGGVDLEGLPGGSFFEWTDGAAGMALAARLKGQPNRLAASADGGQGNGDQATAIAALSSKGVAGLAGSSVGEAWAAMVARIGGDSRRAGEEFDAQSAFVGQLDERRQSISGVNLDEELTLMMQQEQAYNAASRVIGVADEMIQTLLGLV